MKKAIHRKWTIAIAVVLAGVLFCTSPFASQQLVGLALEKLDITLFYRVRFEILGQSPKGAYYTKLFDTYTREITQTIINNPSLNIESMNVLLLWQPNLDALVNGRGNDVVITEKQANAVTTYLDYLSKLVSPQLRSVIVEEQANTPLEKTVGMTMNQAWVYLNQDPRFPSASSASSGITVSPPKFISAHLANLMLPGYSPYSMDFDPSVWDFSSWDNGVAVSWEFVNRSVSDCVVTAPRYTYDPYSAPMTHVENKTLGNFYYESRTVIVPRWGFTMYAIYKALNIPIGNSDSDVEQKEPIFIVYPGYSDGTECIAQSETLLSNIHLSLNDQ